MNLPPDRPAPNDDQESPPSKVQGGRWPRLVRNRRAREGIAALAVGLAAFVVYLTTVAPTILAVSGTTRDAVRFQIAAPLLGIGHPTGYPTFILLGKLFTYLPVGDAAYRLNLMAAFFGALAVALVFLVARRLGSQLLPAVGAALILAFSATFWSQTTMAEVYTMNATFLLGVAYLLLLWRQRGGDGLLLGAALLYGVSLGNHATMVLMAPAYLALVVVGRRKELSLGLLAKAAVAAVLGVAVYLYIPIRGFAGAWHPYYAPVSTPTEIWQLLTGARAQGRMGSSLPQMVGNLGNYTVELGRQIVTQPLGWIAAALIVGLGALGIGTTFRRDRAVGIFLLLAFVLELLYALNFRVDDIAVFYIPTYLLLAIGLAVGVSALAARLPRAGLFVSLVPLLLAAVAVVANQSHVDRSEEYGDRAAAQAMLDQLPADAVVYGRREIYPAVYLVLVEGQRPDVDFRHLGKLRRSKSIPCDLKSERPIFVISNPHYNQTVSRKVGRYDARVVPEGPLLRLVPDEDSPRLQQLSNC